MESLDPRINRFEIPEKWDGDFKKGSLDQLETFEVFVQAKEGKAYQHEGIVHASDLDMAFLFAKEQFSRRYTCSGIWVCKTTDVYVTPFTEDGNSVYDLEIPNEQDSIGTRTFEIFHLYKRGKQHKHVDSLDAATHTAAIIKAKNSIEEAKPVLNIWIIESNKIHANKSEDADMWNTLPEKQFRDAIAYRGADKIKEYKSRMSKALKDLIYKMADDELILGHRNSEWTGLGPMLEEDIAFSSMAQDKIGQSLALYEILHSLGESEPDTVAFTRNADQFHNCQFVELPIGDYDFSIIRHFLFDTADYLRFDHLKISSNSELANLAKKFTGEIKYHLMHGEIWINKLANGNNESKSRLQKSLDFAFPFALGIFEKSQFEDQLIEDNIYKGEEYLKSLWLDKIQSDLSKTSLELNTSVQPKFGGRVGNHTEYLQPLLDEMSEVFRIDPGAEW